MVDATDDDDDALDDGKHGDPLVFVQVGSGHAVFDFPFPILVFYYFLADLSDRLRHVVDVLQVLLAHELGGHLECADQGIEIFVRSVLSKHLFGELVETIPVAPHIHAEVVDFI